MEYETESGTVRWDAAECPFRIECSARVLDDIRLAVVDAFFSLPRGGAEIGGILLGEQEEGRIVINGFEPLDCEHALGPSFVLSARDQALLADLTAKARRHGPNQQPVGWYHSHTRSEIFLSDADQDIYNRFFPEPWQVALVLKPHTFEPARAGFFFREPDGSIHATASYREINLDPLPLRPPTARNGNDSLALPAAVAAEPELAVSPAPGKRKVPITREIAIDPPVAPATDPQTLAAERDVPSFEGLAQERPWRAAKAAAILAIGLAAGGAGYQTRQFWLPQALSKARAALPKEPDSYLSLALTDDNGQLKIQWDRNAPAVRDALEGTLEITDGNSAPQSVRLDGAHLAAGVFTYGRENERVDVTLLASEPDGRVVKEQTIFLGKLPPKAVPDSSTDSDAEKQRADKLQKDANFQAAKIKKLEKDLKAAQDQLQKSTQAPDPDKKD
jgi:proteasome lid subunit RPN8/RPN11